MSIALTRQLGKFISELRYGDIPTQAIAFIHMAFTDTVGVMIAGARESAPQLLKSMLAPMGKEATLAVGGGRASALDAAWINGTAAHALDFDDTTEHGAHPSAVLVPAILAEAEAIGATGEQMVRAYAAGYETFAELARRDPDRSIGRGWHTTGILGTVGAAAACASLHRLNPEQSAMAIALGASQSAGLLANSGTMTKPFHAGHAAHAGIAAARLVAAGFTAAPDALEHAPGFLTIVSVGGSRVDMDAPMRAGQGWQICGSNRLAIKKYPLCYCTHRVLDGVFDLLKDNALNAGEVKRVEVSLSRRNMEILRYHSPQTGLQAKFSIEFAVAAALKAGRAGLAELSDGFVCRSDVQVLMKRVVVQPDDPDGQQTTRVGYSAYDRVVIETHNGTRLDSGPITLVRGDPDLPLHRDELWAKFADCIQAGNAHLPAQKLFDVLMALERLPHARELAALLT